MSEMVLERTRWPSLSGRRAVDLAAKGWFVTAAVGHWIFLAYILAVFFLPILEQGTAGLQGDHLPDYQEGNIWGNLASLSHVLLAAIVIGGGPLQLIPAIRRRLPRFHHWLGRSYVLAAVISSVGGLYMTWAMSSSGDVIR
jgi:hypothetical protein